MRDITELQRRFVTALWSNADGDATRAAREAGYLNNENTKKTAHLLLHNPKIQAAMLEEGQRRFMAESVVSFKDLLKIAHNTEHREQFNAIKMILSRAGFGEIRHNEITVKHELSHIEKFQRLVRLKLELGDDPEPYLANLTPAERKQVLEGVEYKVIENG